VYLVGEWVYKRMGSPKLSSSGRSAWNALGSPSPAHHHEPLASHEPHTGDHH